MELSLSAIRESFRRGGVIRILAKPLAENDNSKQQIYLSGNFDILTELPFGEIKAENSGKLENFKAKLALSWLTPSGEFEPAIHSQLILYPKYPEVRLSGFLRGCPSSPSLAMRPIPCDSRGPKNAWDGRVLFLGVTADGKILAALGLRNSPASLEFGQLKEKGEIKRKGALFELPATVFNDQPDTRTLLIQALTEIRKMDWISSFRMHADGSLHPYKARNGGGYTLEALLGIRPNGRAEPDYMGWEIKAHSGDRVTLMTPEPDAGFYGENGVEKFIRKYGYARNDDSMYFTGIHRVGERQSKTKQLLILEGFDVHLKKITSVTGGITLCDAAGMPSAVWSYTELISHWGRKHANAAYVKYESSTEKVESLYRFLSPVRLGTSTDFIKFLSAMSNGTVIYDPAPKLTNASSNHSTVKARSQFRISVSKLDCLYNNFESPPI
jgi:hypothetical protein